VTEAAEELIPLEEPEPEITELDAAETEEEQGEELEEHVPSSQTVIIERNRKLEAETKRHENVLRKVYGDDFADLAVCPCCLSDGWIIPAPPGAFPPEQWEAVKMACGQEGDVQFKMADYAEPCPQCEGWGKVATGSHVPDLGTPLCRDCNGQGWREKQAPLTAVPQWTPTPPAPATETLALDWTRPRDAYGRPEGHPRFGIDPQYNGGVW
jgi:hypothetical protein